MAEADDDWPVEAREAAHDAWLDTLGVMVRGAAEEAPRRVFASVAAWGVGPAVAVGMGARIATPWAALVNGTAAHVLDFDDNFDPGKAHVSAVLVPAILALAEQERLSGAACVDAYIAGLEITGRVGEGLNPVHRLRGWHSTATVGAIGAAAACARLLGLDAERATHALSLATSMAGGSMAQFGTMAKPLHAGLAAQAGVLAASLAHAGIDAAPGALEGPAGMATLMVGPDYETTRAALDPDGRRGLMRFKPEQVGAPLLLLSEGLRVKRFPNCASAHKAMDGLLELMERHGFGADDVESITIHAAANQLRNLMFTDPADALEAKFSLEFAMAVLLRDGDCRLAHFTLESVRRPDIRALYSKIKRVALDSPDGRAPTEVEVALTDGGTLSAEVAMQAGTLAAPFSRDQLWRKFDDCVGEVLSPGRSAALRDAVARLPELSALAALTDPLMPPLSVD